jgi:hypothetical protein
MYGAPRLSVNIGGEGGRVQGKFIRILDFAVCVFSFMENISQASQS